MQITVLWEDQRGVRAKGFGPHALLVACLVDDEVGTREELSDRLNSIPLKGNGNVLRELRGKAHRILDSGQLFAVFDRDKTHELWPSKDNVPNCMSGVAARLKQDAPGDYEVVFLRDNIESLLSAAAQALGFPSPANKPTPDERDRLLGQLTWGTAEARRKTRSTCPSFDRLVRRVAATFQTPGS
ncbi:MAG: hypothetical protein JW940_36305 [Polyangiaceae bacterium]|nr:hypothetical protein [Polyangiaceae bacterium]